MGVWAYGRMGVWAYGRRAVDAAYKPLTSPALSSRRVRPYAQGKTTPNAHRPTPIACTPPASSATPSRSQPLPVGLPGRPAAGVRSEEGAVVGDLHAVRALEPHAARRALGSPRRQRATVPRDQAATVDRQHRPGALSRKLRAGAHRPGPVAGNRLVALRHAPRAIRA